MPVPGRGEKPLHLAGVMATELGITVCQGLARATARLGGG